MLRTHFCMFGLLVAVFQAMPCAAQQSSKPDSQPPQPDVDNDLLAGPQVDEQAVTQPGGMMGEDRRRAASRIEIPMRQWLNVLRGLNLTPEQQDATRAIMNEFAAAQRTFMEERTEEERALLTRPDVRRPDAADNPERSREQREKMAALEQQRPKMEPYQQRIWQELTIEQQTRMKEELEAIRRRMIDARQSLREDEPARGGEMDDSMMSPAPPAGATEATPQRPRAARRTQAQQLDQLAQRRLRFLLAHQADGAANGPRHVDGEPTPRDRNFQFDE